MANKRKIGVLDIETDPFKYGRVPEAFAVEFYSEDEMHVTWGPDCIADMADWLEARTTDYLIYAHNGGKFDAHYFADYIDNPLKIINARIVSCRLFQHELRDSFAIMPIPLRLFTKKGGKLDIDYDLMEYGKREKHKGEILTYLHRDCIVLHSKVSAFVERFGAKLTVGATAMVEIKKRHTFGTLDQKTDAYFRQFYFGGRVECFKSGRLTGPYKVYDVNSMYPNVMRNFRHPLNNSFSYGTKLPDNFDRPFFAIFRGTNKHALPVITKDGLSFNQRSGLFAACSHEIESAFRHNLITIDNVIEVATANEWISFQEFVDDFYLEKVTAKQNGDEDSEMHSKFMLNSGYGKFGSNPENFQDWIINREPGQDDYLRSEGYAMEMEYEEYELWSRPSADNGRGYYDVSIAASITSASRSVLMDGLQSATDPIYCDTDSIICREFAGLVDGSTLGAWKLEKEAPAVAIAGKKMYALYDPNDADMVSGVRDAAGRIKRPPIKLTSKGGTLTLPELLRICDGETVHYTNMAPTFSLQRETRFVQRNFKMTVDAGNGLE